MTRRLGPSAKPLFGSLLKPKGTVFLCFQIRSLDPDRFVDSKSGKSRLAGTMPPERMAEVDAALKMVLDLH